MFRQRSTMMNMAMWLLASFFYAYQYILRVLPNMMWSDLFEKFQINAEQLGQLNGIYYLGYALMHVPIGLMLDKYGPKKILPVCMAITSLGLLPFVYAQSWAYPCLGRFMIGIGSSAAILGVFKILRIAFSEQKFTRMLGISVTIGLLGAIYGGRPLQWMLNEQGWEMTFKVLISLGVGLALFTYWIVPDQEEVKTVGLKEDFIQVFKNYKVISICLLAGLMVGPLEGFADGWSAGFLEVVYGLESKVASSLPSMIFIGMCLGAPFISLVAEKTKAYFELLALCALIMGACFILMLTGRANVSLLAIVLFVIGVLCSYQILAIYKASTYVARTSQGLTTAIANMIIMMFGYLFHSGIGKLMNQVWAGSVEGGVAVYTPREFCFSLGLIPITLLIAWLGFSLFAWQERAQKRAIKQAIPVS